jgi:hypothetical protein
MTCAWTKRVSCGQRAGESFGHAAASVIEQMNIRDENQPLTKK